MDIEPDPPHITEHDLVELNRRALLRSTAVVRRIAVALVGAGTLVLVGWTWQVLRYQNVITDNSGNGFPFGFPFGVAGDVDLTGTQRIDLFVANLSGLAFAAIVAGLGAGIWLYCEVTTSRAEGSLAGWEVGDPIDDPVADAPLALDADPTA